MHEWTSGDLRRDAWEAHAAALLHGGDEGRLVKLARAYSAIEDINYLVNSEEPPLSTDYDDLINDCLEAIGKGLNEVSALGSIKGSNA